MHKLFGRFFFGRLGHLLQFDAIMAHYEFQQYKVTIEICLNNSELRMVFNLCKQIFKF